MTDKSNDENIPEDPFKPYKGRFKSYHQLPEKGRDRDDIFNELKTMADEEDVSWKAGQCSGTYYHAGEEHRAFLNKAFSLFSHVNVIQMDTCPSMFKLESEIISMTAKMLNGDVPKTLNPEDGVCGSVTSGGSESILMAMKVYRDMARAEKGITEPEIIKPKTAHPAFSKAGKYFGIKIVETPCIAPDYMVDIEAVKQLINKNTVALVGSAGNYPYGLIDPMEKLSDIALEHDLGFHIDGCLGGFILPWIEKLGYKVPIFDFRLPGLTSMSSDTHKFGFGLKGNSVILYRNKKLRRYQFFNFPDFPGGVYASPSMTGSRSGGLTAATWSAMVYLGEEGYMKAASQVMKVADEIKKGVEEIPELKIIGDSTFIISFSSDELDVFHVNDYMITKGWRFNSLQLPPALHFCVTMPQTAIPGIAERLIKDLKDGVDYAKANKDTASQSSALYGIAGSPEGNAQVDDILLQALDHLYDV